LEFPSLLKGSKEEYEKVQSQIRNERLGKPKKNNVNIAGGSKRE